MKKRTKMWIWILALSPVALVLLLAVIGTFLPDTFTARGRIASPLSRAAVWQRLHDPERYPMTGRMCRGVELLPSENGLAVWIEDMGRSKLRIRNQESVEPNRIVRLLEDTVVPFENHAVFTIEESGKGCVITCDNRAKVRSGTWHVPFFRVTMWLFGGARSGCKDYLTRLAGGSGVVEWME